MGTVIPFPTNTAQHRGAGLRPPEKPDEFEFWVEILDDLTPAERNRTILHAFQCGVIDSEIAEILRWMWCDREEV